MEKTLDSFQIFNKKKSIRLRNIVLHVWLEYNRFFFLFYKNYSSSMNYEKQLPFLALGSVISTENCILLYYMVESD